jgi:hypothetical protein
MPRVGFEPTIPASERAKAVRGSGCVSIARSCLYVDVQHYRRKKETETKSAMVDEGIVSSGIAIWK